jgi:hypothetical protein
MDSTDVLQFISAALACTISLSKIGIPTVIAIYKSNYLLALVSSCTGAVFGSVLFTYLFAGILLTYLGLIANGQSRFSRK